MRYPSPDILASSEMTPPGFAVSSANLCPFWGHLKGFFAGRHGAAVPTLSFASPHLQSWLDAKFKTSSFGSEAGYGRVEVSVIL